MSVSDPLEGVWRGRVVVLLAVLVTTACSLVTPLNTPMAFPTATATGQEVNEPSPTAPIPSETAFPATNTPLPATAFPRPSTETPTSAPPTATPGPSFVIVEIFPGRGELTGLLEVEARKAHDLGLKPVAEFKAEW